jgi:hypothetical protein
MGPSWHGVVAGLPPSTSVPRGGNRCDDLRPWGLVRRPNLAGPADVLKWGCPPRFRVVPHIAELEPVHAVEF